MKNIYRAFLYLYYKKRRFHVLIVPILFFTIEISVVLHQNWKLFGEKFAYNPSTESYIIHNPLLVVSFLHSQRIVSPLGNLTPNRNIISLFDSEKIIEVFSAILSLIAAYIGIFISLLWINRFFHENKLEVAWWYWPTSCITSHLFLFILPQLDFMENCQFAFQF